MRTETTPDKIAHGRAMLNTIERDLQSFGRIGDYLYVSDAIADLRHAYDDVEYMHVAGLITDPHPRQVGDRILPRWEWWLHLLLKKFRLGEVEK